MAFASSHFSFRSPRLPHFRMAYMPISSMCANDTHTRAAIILSSKDIDTDPNR